MFPAFKIGRLYIYQPHNKNDVIKNPKYKEGGNFLYLTNKFG